MRMFIDVMRWMIVWMIMMMGNFLMIMIMCVNSDHIIWMAVVMMAIIMSVWM